MQFSIITQWRRVFSAVSTSSQQPSTVKAAGTSTAACLPVFIAWTQTGTCQRQGVELLSGFGSVVIEQIFSVPGLGRYFVQGALNRDYTLVMGVVVFYGVLIIVFKFLVDVIYRWLDPRVKL